MKLIDDGALDEDSVVTLAMRLGISSRHLARLFERHVGATPQQLAKTLRAPLTPSGLRATAQNNPGLRSSP
ncbi:AraC family transcriptional regulator [Bradyrhizobium genosp. SA-3]|uniref:AraC family transcriptional regulator n=1 Tax=Bradyrhizobium genosp. SA-3 TaxID=508868 RepID=UPI0032E49CE6